MIPPGGTHGMASDRKPRASGDDPSFNDVPGPPVA